MAGDRLMLEGLRVRGRIGCYAWEQARMRVFSLDLALRLDARLAARRDAIGDAVDYAAVAEAVRAAFAERPFALIETAAEAVARAVLDGFPAVAAVRVRLRKPLPQLGMRAAVIEIERVR